MFCSQEKKIILKSIKIHSFTILLLICFDTNESISTRGTIPRPIFPRVEKPKVKGKNVSYSCTRPPSPHSPLAVNAFGQETVLAVSFHRCAPHSWRSLLEPRISFSKEPLGLPRHKRLHNAFLVSLSLSYTHTHTLSLSPSLLPIISNLFLRWIEHANNAIGYVHAYIRAHLAVTKSLTCFCQTLPTIT